MNMTEMLDRRSATETVEETAPSGPGSAPPSRLPPTSAPAGRSAWPTSAKVLAVVLLIAAMLGAVGTAVGFASDDGSTERELRDRIATLTEERDGALTSVAAIEAELADLRDQLRAAEADGDELSAEVARLEARIATLSAERDAALGAAEDTAAQLATVQQQLVKVVAERNALAGLFPMKFDASLDGVDLVGDYDLDLSQVFCSNFGFCGKAPAWDDVTITKTTDGYLRIDVDGVAAGGLFRADGALHLVTDSTKAVPACDGAARTARVTMTLFPGRYEIADDGSREIVDLSAVITVDAAATGSCPAGLAFYSAELTPQV